MAKKYKSPTYGLAGKHDGKIDTPDEVDSFLEGFKEDEQLKSLLAKINQDIQALTTYVNTKASIQQLQELATVVNTKADKSLVMYDDVYVGVAASSATVIDDAYHHDSIVRGRPVYFSNADGYLWIVLPSAQNDVVVLMSGVEVQMSVDSTTTINEVEYKVWKSTDSYTGSFNILLF